MTDKINGDTVKKQTLFGAVVLSLVIGFVAGTVYSSFKLASQHSDLHAPQTAQQSTNTQMEQPKQMSQQVASQIFQLEQAIKSNPKNVGAWTSLGNLFFDSGRHADAIEAYNQSLSIEPNNVNVITDLGVMYRRNKQPQKAIETFNRAIQIDPKFETARFNKGIVLLHDLNDVEGGFKAWEELVDQNPMAVAPNGESVDAILQRMKDNQK